MPHRVHGVMRLVAVKRPVTWGIGHEIDRAYCAHGHIDRRLRPLGALRHPTPVGATYGEMVTVEMDRMRRHGEITHSDADPVAEPHGHHVDPREHTGIEAPDIE